MMDVMAAEGLVNVGVPASVVTGVVVWIMKDFMARRKNGKANDSKTFGGPCPLHEGLQTDITEVKEKVNNLSERQNETNVSLGKIETILNERLPKK